MCNVYAGNMDVAFVHASSLMVFLLLPNTDDKYICSFILEVFNNLNTQRDNILHITVNFKNRFFGEPLFRKQ